MHRLDVYGLTHKYKDAPKVPADMMQLSENTLQHRRETNGCEVDRPLLWAGQLDTDAQPELKL